LLPLLFLYSAKPAVGASVENSRAIAAAVLKAPDHLSIADDPDDVLTLHGQD